MTVTLAFPMRTLLLALTMAPAPMAVALIKLPEETSAPFPIAVLLVPPVLLKSAKAPLAVLGFRVGPEY